MTPSCKLECPHKMRMENLRRKPELEHDLAPLPTVNPHVQSFLLVTFR